MPKKISGFGAEPQIKPKNPLKKLGVCDAFFDGKEDTERGI